MSEPIATPAPEPGKPPLAGQLRAQPRGELLILDPDPHLVCPNCGATMFERGCKLRCRCGYFLSCSDI
ncbi:MAG: hypothetical protein FIA92_15095 [Chloroflexi bacterium]|nr:hypothetical protein [Chloroflexota bacterium]